jgi:hypothetical protein
MSNDLNRLLGDAYYEGARSQSRLHLWYLLTGLVMGFVSGAAGMYWMLVI